MPPDRLEIFYPDGLKIFSHHETVNQRYFIQIGHANLFPTRKRSTQGVIHGGNKDDRVRFNFFSLFFNNDNFILIEKPLLKGIIDFS